MNRGSLILLIGLAATVIVGGGVGLSQLTDSGSEESSTPQSLLPAATTAPTTASESIVPSEPDAPVAPDPNFREELSEARISTRGWTTDFSLHSVPYSESISGGPPRDGIPPIDNPKFTTFEDADTWLGGQEPVIALELNGDARACPLQILTWHEIVNDVVGGVPVAVTFCPLCNSAIVFDRRLDGVIYDFGTSGKLRNSDLIMWDRQTESWWQQFIGEAIVGEFTGKQLTFIPASIISWEDFKAANPEGTVLSSSPSEKHGWRVFGGMMGPVQ